MSSRRDSREVLVQVMPSLHADDLLRLGLYGLVPSLIVHKGIALVVEAIVAFGLAVFAFRRIKV